MARRGFGDTGTLIGLGGSGQVTMDELDGKRRRIGLAVTPHAAVYDTYFVVDGKTHTGGVAKLDRATGTEPQEARRHRGHRRHALRRRSGAERDPRVPGGRAPDGDLVTGGKAGAVRRIHASDGTVTTLIEGLAQARGTAWDPEKLRPVPGEHGRPKGPRLLVVPL